MGANEVSGSPQPLHLLAEQIRAEIAEGQLLPNIDRTPASAASPGSVAPPSPRFTQAASLRAASTVRRGARPAQLAQTFPLKALSRSPIIRPDLARRDARRPGSALRMGSSREPQEQISISSCFVRPISEKPLRVGPRHCNAEKPIRVGMGGSDASASAKTLLEHFGITAEAVAAAAKERL